MDDNKNKPMGWPLLYTLATLGRRGHAGNPESLRHYINELAGGDRRARVGTHRAATDHSLGGHSPDLDRTNGKKIREYNRRRKISRTLDESMKGLTLNGVGPIYGIRRNKGENNTDYEKRIREKLGLSPRSLPKYETMEQLTLSNVGPIYGVVKKQDESWKRYRRRILKAARTLDTVNVQNAPKPRKE